MFQQTDKVQDIVKQASSINSVNTIFFVCLSVVTVFVFDGVEVDKSGLFGLSWVSKASLCLALSLALKLSMHALENKQKLLDESQFELTITMLHTATTLFLINAIKLHEDATVLLPLVHSFLPSLLFILVSPLTWNKQGIRFFGFFGFMEWTLLICVLSWGGNVMYTLFLTDSYYAITSNVIVLMSPFLLKLMKKRHLDKFFANMHKEIYIDVLTGIQNRKCFYDFYDKCRAYSKSNKGVDTGFGLIFVDIDHFKKYNDTYGHEQGDICLKNVAERLEKIASSCGLEAFRYGGEEFLVCGALTEDEWWDIISNGHLKVWVDGDYLLSDMKHESSPLGVVSMSGGAAFYNKDVVYNNNAAGITKHADSFLYEAKESGRARLCVSKSVVNVID